MYSQSLANKLDKPKDRSLIETPIIGLNTGKLSSSITNYDLISIGIGHTTDASLIYVSTELYPVSVLKANYGKAYYSVGGNLDTKISFTFTDSQTVKIISQSGNLSILTIIGI